LRTINTRGYAFGMYTTHTCMHKIIYYIHAHMQIYFIPNMSQGISDTESWGLDSLPRVPDSCGL